MYNWEIWMFIFDRVAPQPCRALDIDERKYGEDGKNSRLNIKLNKIWRRRTSETETNEWKKRLTMSKSTCHLMRRLCMYFPFDWHANTYKTKANTHTNKQKTDLKMTIYPMLCCCCCRFFFTFLCYMFFMVYTLDSLKFLDSRFYWCIKILLWIVRFVLAMYFRLLHFIRPLHRFI